MIYAIRETTVFAYLCGFIERLQSDGWGRTHETNHDWNLSYDRGRALAARLVGGDE